MFVFGVSGPKTAIELGQKTFFIIPSLARSKILNKDVLYQKVGLVSIISNLISGIGMIAVINISLAGNVMMPCKIMKVKCRNYLYVDIAVLSKIL